MKAGVVRWVVTAALSGVVVATSVMITGHASTTVLGIPGRGWLGVVVAIGLLAAAITHPDDRAASLLAGAGVVWTAGEWAGWSSGPGWVQVTAGGFRFGAPLAAVATAYAVVRGPTCTRAWQALVTSAIVIVVIGLVWSTFVDDPFQRDDCWRTCRANPLGLGAAAGLRSASATVLTVASVVTVAAALIVVLAGHRRSRRPTSAVQIFGAVVLMLAAVARVFDGRRTALAFAVYTGAAAGVVIGVAAIVQFVHRRQRRAALSRLIDDLAIAPPDGALEASLAKSLRDPGLRVLYWSSERGIHLGPDGRPAEIQPGTGQAVTPVHRGDAQIAVIVHRAGIDAVDVEHAFRPAARLWLDNARLRAATRAELAELRASEARLAVRAAEERMRIERDLHDGAQQRVVGIALLLRMMRNRFATPPSQDQLAAAQCASQLLDDLLATLRQIARRGG